MTGAAETETKARGAGLDSGLVSRDTGPESTTPPVEADDYSALASNVETIASDIGEALDRAELAMAEQISGDNGDDPLDVVAKMLGEIRRHQAALRYYAGREPEGGAKEPAAPRPFPRRTFGAIEAGGNAIRLASATLLNAMQFYESPSPVGAPREDHTKHMFKLLREVGRWLGHAVAANRDAFNALAEERIDGDAGSVQ